MLNPRHITGKFEEDGNIFKKFLRGVAISENNQYFCCVISRLAIVEGGKNKFIGRSLCNG